MPEVTVVHWPEERARREELARAGRARLLVVDATVPPPVASDPLEDWVREPCSELDLRARMEGLRMRLERTLELVPELDDDGVIRFGDRWAPLPPVEARLTGVLVRRFGAVVSRDDLVAAGWPGEQPGRNALDVHVLRLRRRLEPVRLAIRTVRSRGYLLEPAALADRG
jgi:DNA-binding response OmpR family regulator